jgi:hypothetical protein
MKILIWVGVAALCWAIWRCQNDVIFNKLKTNSIMQVIFRGAYWLRSWSQLQRDEQGKDTLIMLSKRLKVIALDISDRGWKHLYRLLWSMDLVLILACCISEPAVVCNNRLCTSMDVEAGFCNPLSKKRISMKGSDS